MTTTCEVMGSVRAALSSYRFTSHDEAKLHELLVEVFNDVGLEALHEYSLSPRDRPDFWLPSCGIVVEVKVQGRPATVLRQLRRYAEHEVVHGIVLLTTTSRLLLQVADLCGKPVDVVRLRGAFG